MGVLFGYIISAWLASTVGWQYAFILQSACYVPLIIAIFITPKEYLEVKSSEQEHQPHQNDTRSISTISLVKQLLKKKLYVLIASALAGLFLIITGLQYWLSDYLQIVYKIPEQEVYYYFSLTCLTAPFSGIVVNGFVMTAMGGYKNPKSFTICLVVAFLGMLIALPIPFLNSKIWCYALIWLLLFSGAFLVPTLTGIMLNSVEESKKTTASSIATLGYNLFGYLPAPVIYGFISSRGSDIVLSSRYALGAILSTSIIIFIEIGTGYWLWIS